MRKVRLIQVFFMLCLSLFCLFATFAFSQEEIQITTYYPSPYGSYRELRANRLAIGEAYSEYSNFCWDGVCAETVDSDASLIIAGNVGIGTHEPYQQLHILGDNPAIRLSIGIPEEGWQIVNNNNRFDFTTIAAGSINTWAVVTPNGRVGIGITDPTELLDVYGQIKARSDNNIEDSIILGNNANGQDNDSEIDIDAPLSRNELHLWNSQIEVDANLAAGAAIFSGGVKIGTDNADCNAAKAGTLRYNSTTNTMEYCNASQWVALGGGGGFHFIVPREFFNCVGSHTPDPDEWQDADLSSWVPEGASAIILEAEAHMNGPDNQQDRTATLKIRSGSYVGGYILLSGKAAGEGDSIAWGGQGIFPVKPERKIKFMFEEPGFNNGARIRLIGYILDE